MDMNCRDGCGACCIAPSISSPIPGMPVVNGVSKPAGVRCVQLDAANRCRIFGRPERPAVCGGLQPSLEMCGDSAPQAMLFLAQLEDATRPALPSR
jgi:Fe-S-cluster containining protein